MREPATILEFFQAFFYSLKFADFAVPFGLILWAILFFLPLSEIDCSNFFAMLIYMAFAAFSGIITVFIVPAKYIEAPSVKSYFLGIIFFSIAAATKWYRTLGEQNRKREVQQKLILEQIKEHSKKQRR